jgi:single-strand DNA-binding protein
MKSMNKVQLIGWLGKDPVIKTAANGTPFAHLRLATDHWVSKENGEDTKITDWHTIAVWGQGPVDSVRHYMMKGSHILVEGRLAYHSYTDKNGQFRQIVTIRAHALVDLDR